MQLYARISGDGPTTYIAGFNAKKLDKKQAWAKENGYGFNLLNHVAAPAAEGIQTPLSKQDADRAALPNPSKIAPYKGGDFGESPPVVRRKPMSSPKAVAVVNVKTGEYFRCLRSAARSIGATPASIGQHLKGKGGSVYGHKFRHATEAEMQARLIQS